MCGICIRRKIRESLPSFYVASVMLGTVLSLDLVWLASDTFNGLMALPNLIALLLMAKVIVRETQDFKRKSEAVNCLINLNETKVV